MEAEAEEEANVRNLRGEAEEEVEVEEEVGGSAILIRNKMFRWNLEPEK